MIGATTRQGRGPATGNHGTVQRVATDANGTQHNAPATTMGDGGAMPSRRVLSVDQAPDVVRAAAERLKPHLRDLPRVGGAVDSVCELGQRPAAVEEHRES